MSSKSQEKHKERHGVGENLTTNAGSEGIVGNVVEHIKASQHATQEEHHQTENNIPRIGHGFESVPTSGPLTDGRGELIGHDFFVDYEISTVEEGANGCAEQHWTENAIEH